MCFVIENEGNNLAHNVSIKINKEFIGGIDGEIERDRLEKLAKAKLYIVSKQRIYAFLGGTTTILKNSSKCCRN